MTLDEVELKEEYDTIVGDDLNKEFFNKVLSESNHCFRVGGLFSSKNFAMCAEGMQKFLENEGEMQLVLTSEFSPDDAKAIEDGTKNAEDVLSENWISSYDDISEKFVENHTKALAWLLAHNKLKIKILIAYDKNGKILDSTKINEIPIFQRKTGIYSDNDDHTVSFSGNIDFEHEIFGRYYHIRVYRNWGEEREKKFVQNDWEEFMGYWTGTKFNENVDFKVVIITLPKVIEKKLLEIKPKSKDEIKLEVPPILRGYQKKAITKWVENDRSGIFEMATGTGKTYTGIGCIDEVRKLNEPFLVVIVCPYSHLLQQWSKELLDWSMNSIVTNESSNWNQRLKDAIESLKRNSKYQIIITTYAIFAKEKFRNTIETCPLPIMLIADEAHHAGAHDTQKGLLGNYKYRLALTATFKRHFDEEGTEILEKYFGGTVYEKSLKDAIDEGFLVGYHYHIFTTDLRDDEYDDYKKLTQTIARNWNSKTDEGQEILKRARLKRAGIIANAKNKLQVLQNIISKNPDLKYLLIFTTGKRLDEVKKILSTPPNVIIQQEITDDVPKNKKDRLKIIKALTDEQIGAIISIGVLDEGVDIPAAQQCIIMSSSGNPKQFIQRRGRVLRKYTESYKDGSKKNYAVIYDIVVIPELSDEYTDDEISIEQSIVHSQLERLEMMGRIAINHEECIQIINQIKNKFRI